MQASTSPELIDHLVLHCCTEGADYIGCVGRIFARYGTVRCSCNHMVVNFSECDDDDSDGDRGTVHVTCHGTFECSLRYEKIETDLSLFHCACLV